jgi:hypothetical protein
MVGGTRARAAPSEPALGLLDRDVVDAGVALGHQALGLPWRHTWGSGRFAGIARDAGYLAERILEHAAAPGARATDSALAA